jgi:chromosome segregation ATPase
MARELNRELFGASRANETPAGEVNSPVAFAKADEVRVLHLHVENISKRLKEFESRLETMYTKTDELAKTNKQRFERVQGHFHSQNERIQAGFNDVNGKIAQVVSRVNERKVSEGVVKEMVERQSSLIQTFEVRMQQLQRVISEQELQLMNARSELKEALQELSRLKKL